MLGGVTSRSGTNGSASPQSDNTGKSGDKPLERELFATVLGNMATNTFATVLGNIDPNTFGTGRLAAHTPPPQKSGQTPLNCTYCSVLTGGKFFSANLAAAEEQNQTVGSAHTSRTSSPTESDAADTEHTCSAPEGVPQLILGGDTAGVVGGPLSAFRKISGANTRPDSPLELVDMHHTITCEQLYAERVTYLQQQYVAFLAGCSAIASREASIHPSRPTSTVPPSAISGAPNNPEQLIPRKYSDNFTMRATILIGVALVLLCRKDAGQALRQLRITVIKIISGIAQRIPGAF